MYVECKCRKIEDHDIVNVRVDVVAPDENFIPWITVTFTRGYLNELQILPPNVVYNNLKNIEDIYATICIKLNDSEINDLKLNHNAPKINSDDVLQISVDKIMRLEKRWNLSEVEKVEVATLLKQRGNYKSQNGDWSSAFKNYLRASRYLYGAVCVTSSNPDWASARQLLMAVMNNVALACLRLSSGYRLCIKYCDRVLFIEPHNTKAHFRKAKALAALKEYGTAVACLDSGIANAGSSRGELERLRVELAVGMRQQIEEEGELYRGVVERLAEGRGCEKNGGEDKGPYGVGDWDNAMADEMMSISEELAAFGEEMPPRRVARNGAGLVATIEEEVDDEDGPEEIATE